MRARRNLTCLVLLLPLLSACPPPNEFVIPTDGSLRDGDVDPGCVPGRIYCSGGRRYECDSAGNQINLQDCPAGAPVCVPNAGCRVCDPASTSASRCSPMDPQQVQSCRPDGNGYNDGLRCDGAHGEACVGGRCVSRCEESNQGRSYLGCDYWPTITANSMLDPGFEFAVALSNPQSYAVHVTITGGGLATTREVDLPPSGMPGSIQTLTLPWVDDLVQFDRRWGGCVGPSDPRCFPYPDGTRQAWPPAHSVLRTGGAYHVHANGPIAAYQFNPLNYERGSGSSRLHSFTNDASLLLPQGVLTQHYLVATYSNLYSSSQTLGGFVSIVGAEPRDTPVQVTVRLTSAISAGAGVAAAPAGSTRMFQVRQGDVLQLVGTGMGDLTGTSISADGRIAVFVGHDCTNIPPTRPACDHLEEQLFPNETWGRDYVVSALRDRGDREASLVRIVSQAADNTITFNPSSVHAPVTLAAGQMFEFQPTADFQVGGTRAFLVTQFMIGQGSDTTATADPAMVLEVPTEQYRTSYDFVVPSTYQSNFINIVAPTGASLTMDGAAIDMSRATTVGSFTVFHSPVVSGTHHIQSAGSQQFGIKVYGVAIYTSYMYPGGLDLRLITPG